MTRVNYVDRLLDTTYDVTVGWAQVDNDLPDCLEPIILYPTQISKEIDENQPPLLTILLMHLKDRCKFSPRRAPKDRELSSTSWSDSLRGRLLQRPQDRFTGGISGARRRFPAHFAGNVQVCIRETVFGGVGSQTRSDRRWA